MTKTQKARPALIPPLLFALTTLLITSLSRVGLVAWQHDRVLDAGDVWTPLLLGLRFDLALIGMAVLVVLAPTLILRPLARTAGLARAWVTLSTTVLMVLVVQTEAATPNFVGEYDARPNDLYVEYLVYPREVLATLWGEHPFALVGLFAAVVVTAALFLRAVWGRPAAYGWKPTGATLAVVALSLVAARSSLRHRPINPSVACYSGDAMVNTLPLPSLYSVAYAAYETKKHGTCDDAPYGEVGFDDAVAGVRASLGITGPWNGTGSPTAHEAGAPTPREPRPLNYVIILEESLGAEFVGALGGEDLTPNLDALLSEGLSFPRLYATGTRSVRGIEALVSGFPPTPARSVVKLPRAQRDFFTVATLLGSRGYDTSFLYGGEGHFDNMARFFTGNGFQHIVDQDDYEDPLFAGSWGVCDQDLLRRAHERFESMGDTPFFSLVFTSSNHCPWEFPTEGLDLPPGEVATRENAVRYADHALGEFFGLARASSYWDDTVFLVVADHNSRVFGHSLVPVERFRIPAVFLGGSIEPGTVRTLASQIDLLPTALGLIGVHAEVPCVGRDLLAPGASERPGRAILQYHQTCLYLEEQRGVVLRPNQAPLSVRWDGTQIEESDAPFPELVTQAEALAAFAHGVYRRRLYH